MVSWLYQTDLSVHSFVSLCPSSLLGLTFLSGAHPLSWGSPFLPGVHPLSWGSPFLPGVHPPSWGTPSLLGHTLPSGAHPLSWPSPFFLGTHNYNYMQSHDFVSSIPFFFICILNYYGFILLFLLFSYYLFP